MNNQPQQPDARAVQAAMAQPFDPKDVKFKPQSVKGTRALALPYVDCRVIQDRLDEVLGVDGWQDDYQLLPDGSVMCRLRVRLGGRWITKTDVGGPSEQPDGGDRLKAAFSDALKRAAVKFGIGRYLYRLKADWCDYDPAKRQFLQTPALPVWAMPGGAAPPPKAPPARPAVPAPAPRQTPEAVRYLPAEDQPSRPPADAPVAAEQVRQLRELIAEKGADEDALLAHYGVRSVAQLTGKQFADAVCKLTVRAAGPKPRKAG